MDRPTVHDLARNVQVSLETVDRVLNGRSGIRNKTVIRVKQGIDELRDICHVNAATLRHRRSAFCAPARMAHR